MSKRLPVVAAIVRPLARDPLLIEVIAAIGAGNIELGPIHDDQFYIHGYCDDAQKNRIRVNPSIDTVDTIVHEAIHRMRPTWNEARVRRKTAELFAQLSDAEVDKIYEIVLTVAEVKRKPRRLR